MRSTAEEMAPEWAVRHKKRFERAMKDLITLMHLDTTRSPAEAGY